MQRDDGVQAIALFGKQRGSLELLQPLVELVKFGRQFGRDAFTLAGEFEIGVEVSEGADKASVGFEFLFQPSPLGKNPLRRFLVLPEVRPGNPLLYGR